MENSREENITAGPVILEMFIILMIRGLDQGIWFLRQWRFGLPGRVALPRLGIKGFFTDFLVRFGGRQIVLP